MCEFRLITPSFSLLRFSSLTILNWQQIHSNEDTHTWQELCWGRGVGGRTSLLQFCNSAILQRCPSSKAPPAFTKRRTLHELGWNRSYFKASAAHLGAWANSRHQEIWVRVLWCRSKRLIFRQKLFSTSQHPSSLSPTRSCSDFERVHSNVNILTRAFHVHLYQL